MRPACSQPTLKHRSLSVPVTALHWAHLGSLGGWKQTRGPHLPRRRPRAALSSAGDGRSRDYNKYPEVFEGTSTSEPAPSVTGWEDRLGPNQRQSEAHYYQEEPPAGPLEAVMETRWGRGLVVGAAVFLVSTLGIALFRTAGKRFSPQAQKSRNLNKNRLVVDTLAQYLPNNRGGLTPGVILRLKLSTGFSPVELFRKYLWFLLRERRFDEAALQDMVALKFALQLNDAQVAEALKERAQRIYERYGNVMMDVAGMTKAGVERKATVRALFSKLLFLAESEQLMDQTSPAARELDIAAIFGALPSEADDLRILSLAEVDIDKLESQFAPDQGPPAV